MQTQHLQNQSNFLNEKIDFETIRAEKQRIAMFYGLAAGAVFSLVTWGYDALQAALAHGMFPWLAFGIGLVACALIGGLAGWVTYRINNLLAAFVCWLVAGLAFAWLAGHVSFTVLEQAIAILNPTLSHMVAYPIVVGVLARQWIVWVVVVGLSVLAGMLEINLADSTANASGWGGRAFPVLVWVVLFTLAGLAPENNLSSDLRKPISNVNATIQYALDHPNEPLNKPTDPSFRTGALLDIQGVLEQPHSLILQKYDDSLYDTTVIGRFGDAWVTCSVSDAQLVYCKPASAADLTLKH